MQETLSGQYSTLLACGPSRMLTTTDLCKPDASPRLRVSRIGSPFPASMVLPRRIELRLSDRKLAGRGIEPRPSTTKGTVTCQPHPIPGGQKPAHVIVARMSEIATFACVMSQHGFKQDQLEMSFHNPGRAPGRLTVFRIRDGFRVSFLDGNDRASVTVKELDLSVIRRIFPEWLRERLQE